MKTNLLTTFTLLISIALSAQNGFNYKALIKDNSGNAIANQATTVQFQILEDGTTNVYQETHNPTTDANGIIIVNIGEGTVVSGNFVAINWGDNNHFLNVQIDSGNGLVDLGTTQFKSVPYAVVAERVTASTTKSLKFPNGLENTEAITVGGPVTYTVPTGKNLYITNFALLNADTENDDLSLNDLDITANGGEVLSFIRDRFNAVFYGSHVPNPIIIAENEQVILKTNGSFNGFLSSKGNVEPFAYKFISTTDQFEVPFGKRLCILSLNSTVLLTGDNTLSQILSINDINVYLGTGNSFNVGFISEDLSDISNLFNPFLADAGDVIKGSEDMVIFGYLIDN